MSSRSPSFWFSSCPPIRHQHSATSLLSPTVTAVPYFDCLVTYSVLPPSHCPSIHSCHWNYSWNRSLRDCHPLRTTTSTINLNSMGLHPPSSVLTSPAPLHVTSPPSFWLVDVRRFFEDKYSVVYFHNSHGRSEPSWRRKNTGLSHAWGRYRYIQDLPMCYRIPCGLHHCSPQQTRNEKKLHHRYIYCYSKVLDRRKDLPTDDPSQ